MNNQGSRLAVGHAIPRGQVPNAICQLSRVDLGAWPAVRERRLFGDVDSTGNVDLYAVLADTSARCCMWEGDLDSDRFPSLTPDCPRSTFRAGSPSSTGPSPGHPWSSRYAITLRTAPAICLGPKPGEPRRRRH
jgi:hypothetical protein